jgi:peptide/nickel transport system permease protein
MIRKVTVLLVTLSLVALLAPWLAPYDPDRHHRGFLFAPPMTPHVVKDGGLRAPFVYPIALTDRMAQRYVEDRARTRPLPWFDRDSAAPVFLAGADSFGRDVLSRLLYGARVSIALALISVFGTLVLGALIGAIAGYRGGWIDEAAMHLADFVVVLPVIYVVLVLRAVMPLVLPATTVFLLMAVIFVLVGWPFVARGVRSIISAEREREYVVAARSLGASNWRIVTRHLLPACAGYLLVQATLLLPAFVLAEATLSFVGLGFPDEVPAWGTMLSDAANVGAMSRFPWTLAPAAAIFLVVLSANVILHSDKIASRSSVNVLR